MLYITSNTAENKKILHFQELAWDDWSRVAAFRAPTTQLMALFNSI
jgi:hypothetical protein